MKLFVLVVEIDICLKYECRDGERFIINETDVCPPCQPVSMTNKLQ